MKIEVRITRSFKKAIKPLIKKYPSVIKDLEHLQAALLKNPTTGTSLGKMFIKSD
jgi:mRNA-degrading endonuclease RelE of RelBE toxin-antitoxin system